MAYENIDAYVFVSLVIDTEAICQKISNRKWYNIYKNTIELIIEWYIATHSRLFVLPAKIKYLYVPIL